MEMSMKQSVPFVVVHMPARKTPHIKKRWIGMIIYQYFLKKAMPSEFATQSNAEYQNRQKSKETGGAKTLSRN